MAHVRKLLEKQAQHLALLAVLLAGVVWVGRAEDFRRAPGADHFDGRYRDLPFVRRIYGKA